jgi:hypothetical protein
MFGLGARIFLLAIQEKKNLTIRISWYRNTCFLVLINYQLDAQFLLYIYIYIYLFIYLFRFSTCFEQPCAYHQESQLYQYNICYMSLCVGAAYRTYTRCCINKIDYPDDEYKVARNM